MAVTDGGYGNSSVGADSNTNAPGAASTSSSDNGPETRTQDGYVWQKVFDTDVLGRPLTTFKWERVGPAKDASSGGGASHNYALDAAQASLSGFLQAQSLADARKMAAMENFQKLAKYALPPGAKYAPGYEPGGMAQTLAARQGLKQYTPPAITPVTVNPNDVAGQIPPEVLAMIGNVKAAAGG